MINQFYNNKISQLKNCGVESPELDLRLMINKSSKIFFYTLNELSLKDINLEKFNYFFKRRIKGEPISKIFIKPHTARTPFLRIKSLRFEKVTQTLYNNL